MNITMVYLSMKNTLFVSMNAVVANHFRYIKRQKGKRHSLKTVPKQYYYCGKQATFNNSKTYSPKLPAAPGYTTTLSKPLSLTLATPKK